MFFPGDKIKTSALATKTPLPPRFVAVAGNETVTEQPPFDFYSGPPEPGDRFFMAFTLDHDEGLAAVVFARRHGRPPEFVFESRGNLLCGPIPGEVL